MTVGFENDADAGTLAEPAWGAGKNKSKLVQVQVGLCPHRNRDWGWHSVDEQRG